MSSTPYRLATRLARRQPRNPIEGEYIAWNVPHVGTTVRRVVSHTQRHNNHWVLAHHTGSQDGWDRLPRGWRYATETEIAEYERTQRKEGAAA